jgi:hypothetical protein
MDPNLQVPPGVGSQTQGVKDPLKKVKLQKILLIVSAIVILIMLGVILWFGSRAFVNDKSLNAKYEAGVSDGRSIQKSEDRKQVQEATENPYRTYKAPNQYGGFEVSFPKNWSLAINSSTQDPIIGMAHPDLVDIKNDDFALRFTYENAKFADTQKKYDKQTKEAKRSLISEPTKVSGIDGIRYTGDLESSSSDPNKKKKVGTVVIVPVRDKTLIFQTDSNENYLNYFNEILSKVKIYP